MASPDPPEPPESPSGSPSDLETLFFEVGERVRWLTYTGMVIHHRGVPYVLFDHHRAPPGAAYAVTKLARISPVQAVAGGEAPSVPPGPQPNP